MSQKNTAYLPIYQHLHLSHPKHVTLCENSDIPVCYRDDIGGVYVGKFTLEGVSSMALDIANRRQSKLHAVVADLIRVKDGEHDMEVVHKINRAIKEAEKKIHLTYHDFEHPFTQACIDSLRLKIQHYEKQEREREKQSQNA